MFLFGLDRRERDSEIIEMGRQVRKKGVKTLEDDEIITGGRNSNKKGQQVAGRLSL